MTSVDQLRTQSVRTLEPALAVTKPPSFPGAVWIGLADDLPSVGTITLESATGFNRARLLMRRNGIPIGFAEIGVREGCIDAAEAWIAVSEASKDAESKLSESTPGATVNLPITVAICTRDRVDLLANALDSVLRQEYPDFEVIIVDNAAETDATKKYLEGLRDRRVRVIEEPAPGLSRARNAAIRAARHSIVAFTDDDVVVDSEWLAAIGGAFAADPDTLCVSGLVPTGELTSAAHAYFDRRVGWARNLHTRRYSLADPPSDIPLFPFQVGMYGTGANFAIKRDTVIALGGFNELLGAGAPTKGGEDLDMFFRIIMAGGTLTYEPSAIVWHRHRDDVASLIHQAHGYGRGLGAWLTTIALSSDARNVAVKTVVANVRTGYRVARAMRNSATPDDDLTSADIPANIRRMEMIAILSGPSAYLRGLREGRKPRPLAGRPMRTRSHP